MKKTAKGKKSVKAKKTMKVKKASNPKKTVTVKRVSRYGLIIDGLHCPKVSREQMERTLKGKIGAVNLTILRPEHDFDTAMVDLGHTLSLIDRMSDRVTIVRSAREIRKAHEEGRLAIIMGTQNSMLVEKDLSLLTVLQRLGFRILQPTYNEPNLLGYGATCEEDQGLSELGRQWVHEMNRLRMVIDLSHSGNRTSADAIAESNVPVMFSHANAYALCDSPRNKPDALIRALVEKGGMIGAVCWAPVLKKATRPTLEDYFDQVAYLVNLAGIDHVSFASDLSEGGKYASVEEWDKSFGPHGRYPTVTGVLGDWYTFETRFTLGFETLAHTPRIWDGLLKRGFKRGDVEKIMGGNLLRFYRAIWGE